mgnify:CR=1 FL=1
MLGSEGEGANDRARRREGGIRVGLLSRGAILRRPGLVRRCGHRGRRSSESMKRELVEGGGGKGELEEAFAGSTGLL